MASSNEVATLEPPASEGAPRAGSLASSPLPDRESAWVAAAQRVHRRYQIEIVESCGLCPWAERSRTDGKVRDRVLLHTDPTTLAPSLAAIQELEADPRAEVGFLIYPRLALRRSAFERFVAAIREANAALHPLGDIPFVLAAFHPEANPDTVNPERLIPFLRRTPDPTIQLLRESVLDRVRNGAPQGTQFFDATKLDSLPEVAAVPLRERIARTNFATAMRMGLDVLTARLDDIRRDRDAAYAAIVADEGAPSARGDT